MPLSPSYNPVTSFANDETNTVAGRSTVRTVALDTELANAASSINGLKTNIEKIQRDDGKLKDFAVEPYALSEQARALLAGGGKPRGLWVVSTVYAVADVVQQSGFAYICYTAHTSSSPFTVSGFWIAISGDGSANASASAAAASQVAAAASQVAAAASAASASTSQTNASASATATANNATASANSATAAANSAVLAANSAGAASGFNDAAYAAAVSAQASASSVNLPTPLTGKALNLLRVKADETGYEHRTGTQVRSDIAAAASGAVTGSGLTQSTARILGRTTASIGAIEEISIGTGLSLSAGVLSSSVVSPFSASYTSPNQTITLAGALSLTHSLGGMPSLLQVRLKCLTAEGGYSIGDEMMYNLQGDFDGTTIRGLSVVPTATTVDVRFSANSLQAVRKDTGGPFAITPANWALIVWAWR